jgi:ectoine hydroxylase-related dioxygenase (phytanoyl-CoA dioxygenase family)
VDRSNGLSLEKDEMNSTPLTTIPDSCVEQFETDGFFVLPGIISPQQIEMLREECDRSVVGFEVEDDCEGNPSERSGGKGHGLHTQNRYIIRNRGDKGPVAKVLASGPFASICRATLGDAAYLFWAQFVIIGPEEKMAYRWRQPSWSVKVKHRPYIACAIALDDMTEANGAFRLLPFSLAGIRELVSEEEGYDGPEEGKAITMAAGGVAVYSSHVFYRTCSNRTKRWRRAFYARFSTEQIGNPDGTSVNFTIPFLVDGKTQIGAS